MIYDNITTNLKELRETGQQIITPDYCITFNPYTDTFSLDVPEHRKCIILSADQLEKDFIWSGDGMYPVEVSFNGDYDIVWEELKPFINGVNIELIPTSFEVDGNEYIWFDDFENGYTPILREDIRIKD